MKDITNGKTTLELDVDSLDKCLAEASKMKTEYGVNTIPDMNCTGDAYYDKAIQLIDIANRIMDGTLVPDILDHIPLKKNGEFITNRLIPIFTNHLVYAVQYDTHLEKEELILAIRTYETLPSYLKNFGCIISQKESPTLATLTITQKLGASKIYPLLDKDLNVLDIKTKTSYIPAEDVIPGCIYREKSGTEYLYLGQLQLTWNKDAILYYDTNKHTLI